jgi:hypothetical protein
MQPEALAPAATVVPSSSFAGRAGEPRRSSFRSRSSSVPQVIQLVKVDDVPASPSGGGFWWSLSRRGGSARPWSNAGEMDDNNTIPEEQKENWEQTRKVISFESLNEA